MANSPNPFAHKSPFEIFRRNQKMLLAATVVLCMFGFVVLPSVMDMMQDGPSRAAEDEVLRWKYGKINRMQLEARKMRRQQALAFIQGAYQLALSKGRQPTPPPFSIDPRDGTTINTMVLARKAEDLGIVVTNETVESLIRQITADAVTAEELRELIAGFGTGPGRATLPAIYETLREELAAREVQVFFVAGLQTRTPAEQFEAYVRANRQVEVDAIAVPVADFVDEAPEPSEAELEAYFEQYKNQLSFPQSVDGTALDPPTPGFMLPRRLKLQYVHADTAAMIEAEMTQITDAEIEEYYEQNKALFPAAEGSGQATAPSSGPVPDINLFPDSEPGDVAPEAGSDEAAEASGEETLSEEGEAPDSVKNEAPVAASPDAAAEAPASTAESSEPAGNDDSSSAADDDSASADEDPAPEPQAGDQSAADPGSLSRDRLSVRFAAFQNEAAAQEESAEPAPDAAEEQPAAGDEIVLNEVATDQSETPDGEASDEQASDFELGFPELDAAAPPSDESEAPIGLDDLSLGDSVPEIGGPGAAAVENVLGDVLGGVLSGETGAVGPTQPLSEVSERIRRRIASERVGEQVDEAFGKVETAVAEYSYAVELARADEEAGEETAGDSEPPAFPDLAAILLDYPGLELRETPLIGPVELRREEAIGESMRLIRQTVNVGGQLEERNQPVNFVDYAFTQRIGNLDPFQSFSLEPAARYLTWKVDDVEAETPTLDQVRDKVVAAWKLERSRPAAEERAKALKTLIDEAGDAPLQETLAPEGVEIIDPGPFSWTTQGLAPGTLDTQGREPQLSRVEGLDQVGPDFMKAVFALEPGETTVAFNYPKTIAYVVRVRSFRGDVDTLRGIFMFAARMQTFGDSNSRRAAYEDFRRDVFEEYDVTIMAPLDADAS